MTVCRFLESKKDQTDGYDKESSCKESSCEEDRSSGEGSRKEVLLQEGCSCREGSARRTGKEVLREGRTGKEVLLQEGSSRSQGSGKEGVCEEGQVIALCRAEILGWPRGRPRIVFGCLHFAKTV